MEKLTSRKQCCVYCHTNLLNKKKYIGITSNNPHIRWANGNGYHHNSYFSNAIKKYGWDNFSHKILVEGVDEDYAKALEKFLILIYHTNDKRYGYNLSSGGEPMSGKAHSEETKKKMSEAAKGRTLSDETKRKISEALKQRDTELVYKFVHSHDGMPSWNKGLKGKDNPLYGVKHSETRKRNQALGRTQRYVRHIETGKIYLTAKDAAKDLNISVQKVYAHCSNTVKCPIFEYVSKGGNAYE